MDRYQITKLNGKFVVTDGTCTDGLRIVGPDGKAADRIVLMTRDHATSLKNHLNNKAR